MKTLRLLGFLLLVGCASMAPEYKKVALLHVGMSKQEVIATFGQPYKTVRQGPDLEIISYQLADTRPSFANPQPLKTGHYIVINHGRVEAFGKE